MFGYFLKRLFDWTGAGAEIQCHVRYPGCFKIAEIPTELIASKARPALDGLCRSVGIFGEINQHRSDGRFVLPLRHRMCPLICHGFHEVCRSVISHVAVHIFRPTTRCSAGRFRSCHLLDERAYVIRTSCRSDHFYWRPGQDLGVGQTVIHGLVEPADPDPQHDVDHGRRHFRRNRIPLSNAASMIRLAIDDGYTTR